MSKTKLYKPPILTLEEEAINAITHGIGALLAIFAFTLLLIKSNTPIKIVSSIIYGTSMFILMSMSSIYHAIKSETKLKNLWRRFDYISIYLLIAGTFAPILLVYFNTPFSILIFIIQWIIVFVGIIIIAIFSQDRWPALQYILYFTIGWSGLMFVPYFYEHNIHLLITILFGGIIYTLGMIPFALNKKYFHCIWHLFVLLGAFIHWYGIYYYIY